MTYGLWLSAAGMQVNQYRQNILANNLANANTVGFKKDLAVLSERLVESRTAAAAGRYGSGVLDNISGGTFVAPTYHSFANGHPTPTGNPLDVAIDGEGFFTVRVGNETRYTRDGRLTVNSENELVMVSGGGRAKLLDDTGSPVTLLPTSVGGKPQVLSDGTVRQNGTVVGKLGVVEFADRNTLRKVGANLFQATAGRPQPAAASTVLAGTVEQSNADPVEGLATLIEVSRAYQLNAQMISLQDTTIGQAVSRVGRIG
ncbi:MAG: flagellar hook-basal body protein [Planctomycetota bacterium]|jgi:flagellar basal body rod protein FlgG